MIEELAASGAAAFLSRILSAIGGMMVVVPQKESDSEGNQEDRARREEITVENIMKAAQIHLVVATLLMTVTFTAGFTLPGGFESDTESPNKGMAILLRRTAFRAFVVSDSIAFACSAGAVFTYFAMAANAISVLTELTIIILLYRIATILQLLAMSAVVIAFATGMYVTLAHSVGLAVVVCVIGCISFVMFCSIMVLLPGSRPSERT